MKLSTRYLGYTLSKLQYKQISLPSIQLIGAVLVVIGVVILFLMREILLRLIIFVLQFIGVLVGILLVAIGLGLLFGGGWIRRKRWVVV
jgi:hypothetical protein